MFVSSPLPPARDAVTLGAPRLWASSHDDIGLESAQAISQQAL